jgi:hypothetical protein
MIRSTVEGLVAIQSIQTSWSKKSRGGAQATARNSIPDSLPIPVRELGGLAQGLIEHSVSYVESHGFDSPYKSDLLRERVGRVRTGCVLIEPSAAGLKVVFEYDAKLAGMPVRYSPPGGKPSTRMDLQLGQWGRVAYNGRFPAEGGWWYMKYVVNVGLFKEFAHSIFTTGPPSQEVSQMAKLW